VPVLSRGDSQLLTPRSTLKKILKSVLYRWGVKQFDAHLYVGQRNKEYLMHYGVNPERLFFSPHFIDNSWFHSRALEIDREKIRTELGCNDGQTLILFVGKFIDKKRPLDLINALSQLQREGVPVKGVFVGSGPLEQEIKMRVKELGVDAVFLGFKNQTQLPAFYVASDLLILPSDGGETWGLVVNEAMACGTPAIVSDEVGCGPDLIDEYMSRQVFPVGDTIELAREIKNLMPMLGTAKQKKCIEEKIHKYSLAEAVKGVFVAVDALCPFTQKR
jgi:glycosyltransferase involved in cell wall biosynthesis